jgi:Tfp pilus assembly protein FimT
MIIQRKTEGGFSMRDILIVLALLGVGALSLPASKSEASASDGAAARDQGFADQVLRELQRARGEAVTTRVPRHAFVYSNRIEIRAAKRGPGRAFIAPTTSDPVLRTVRAQLGVSTVDVTSRVGLPSFTLSETSAKEIVFGTAGTGALASARAGRPAALHLYITNDTVSDSHPLRAHRVDIAPSGIVSLVRSW